MKNFFFTILIFNSILFSQEKNHLTNDSLFSPYNIKRFADFLYCQKDYLRAADEYVRYLGLIPNDTIEFKIALSYSLMNNYDEAAKRFNSIKESSSFYQPAQIQFLKSLFQSGNYVQFRNKYSHGTPLNDSNDCGGVASLYMFSFLLTDEPLPNEDEFLMKFPALEKIQMKSFYDWKKNPPEKSSIIAAIFSTIIPGMGKIYTHDYSDGIFAFISTLGAGYLAYDNFKAGHNFRGWIFTGLTAGFYGGNIYGSAAAAQIYNAHIRFDFINDLETYLEDNNYFLKIFNFCK
jgi:tetratricopeptide (TPR) repeat protein